jgi:hypothetical protein
MTGQDKVGSQRDFPVEAGPLRADCFAQNPGFCCFGTFSSRIPRTGSVLGYARDVVFCETSGAGEIFQLP